MPTQVVESCKPPLVGFSLCWWLKWATLKYQPLKLTMPCEFPGIQSPVAKILPNIVWDSQTYSLTSQFCSLLSNPFTSYLSQTCQTTRSVGLTPPQGPFFRGIPENFPGQRHSQKNRWVFETPVDDSMRLYTLPLEYEWNDHIHERGQNNKQSPSHHHFYMCYVYHFPVMGGLWHCFTHIVPIINHY